MYPHPPEHSREKNGFAAYTGLFFSSLNPSEYGKLVRRPLKSCFAYFFCMLLCVLLVTALLFLPTLLSADEYVEQQLSKFAQLRIEITHQLKEPIAIPAGKNPLLRIDTLQNVTAPGSEFILITDDTFFYRVFPFENATRVHEAESALSRTRELGKLLGFLFLFLTPALFLLLYVWYAIKFLFFVFVIALAGFVLARVARFGIEFTPFLKISLHASTALAMLHLFTRPFTPSIGYVEYAAFVILVALGALTVGDFEEVVQKKKEGE